jgi:transcriptional regulator
VVTLSRTLALASSFHSLYSFHKTFMGDRLTENKDQPRLLQGTLDLLVLRALLRGGPMHGYAIAEFIQQNSEGILKVEEGALYPALHRLELRGWLASEWGVSDNNRRAKYYRLTAIGQKQLATESEQWRRLSGAVMRILEA